MPTTLTAIPAQIEAGDTVLFTESFADFAPGTYTLSLVLNNGASTPTTIAATTSGTGFLFTLTAAVTAALTAGAYSFAMYATAGAARYTAKTGALTVLPNLSATAPPSFARAQVTLLQTALAELNSTGRQTVNFNGQSFTRANVADYQKQLVYWQAAVIREQAAANALRDVSTGNRIPLVFLGSTSSL